MQKVLRGANSLQLLATELEQQQCRSVCLVTGKHFMDAPQRSIFNTFDTCHLLKNGVNVSADEARVLAQQLSDKRVDALVAIGGGSVLDAAKAMIHLSQSPAVFAAVPTTIGSGSESTPFAVVYQHGKKESWIHPSLLPQIVVLDPVLVQTLPAYQAACTGMDCVSQAIESWWNVQATETSRGMAEEAIRGWMNNFQDAVGGNSKAREAMLYSAYAAGCAIAITRTTGPHALSYFLSSRFGIAHGQAVALFLPLFFRYNQPGHELCALLQQQTAEDAAVWIESEMRHAGLQTNFAGLGIERDLILDELLDEVNEQRFANNPVSFHRERLKQLIQTYL